MDTMLIDRLARRARRAWLTAAGLALALTAPICPAEPLDGIVAVVNEDVIVRSELEREIATTLPELEAQGVAIPSHAQLEEQVLDSMILDRLQLQEAKRVGIEADEETLTRAMTSIAMRNGLSLEELAATLEQSGLRFEDFRESTRRQLITSRLLEQEVRQKIRVSEPEIEMFLEREADTLIEREEVKLQHILVAVADPDSDRDVARAQSKARNLVKRLRAGAGFAALARSNSDGRRAAEGGDLGWFKINEVPPLIAEPAQTLQVGEISDPIRSPSGFHIVRVAEIRAKQSEPLTQTHARHILIRTSEILSDDDAKRRLTQLRLRLLGGADFETLARSHSDDTGSALKGGDLGWVNPGDTVPAFEEAMNALQPGEISQPFQSPFGWHLVQVIERRTQDTADEALRLKAINAIRSRKAKDATDLWLRRLRGEAYVVTRLHGH